MIEKLKEIKSISDIKNLKPNIGKKQEPPKPNKPNNKYSFRFKKFKDLRIGAKPVSYTHLDVYKRQPNEWLYV